MYKILLIEDDNNLRKQVAELLKLHEYEVHAVTDFRNVMSQVDQIHPDLIVLDINLPYLDGNYICRMIRKQYQMPIIITSARNAESDQVLSMELGSDDYLVKPFNINVLISHIAACLRRAYGAYNNAVTDVHGMKLDELGMKLVYHDQSVELSKNEFILVKMFLKAPDQVLTREALLEAIWDDSDFVDDNTLTVNVTRIKKKFEQMGLTNVIRTKRGVGYLYATEGLQ